VRTMPLESLARANITSLFAARIESDFNVRENFPSASVLNGEEDARYLFVAEGIPNTYAYGGDSSEFVEMTDVPVRVTTVILNNPACWRVDTTGSVPRVTGTISEFPVVRLVNTKCIPLGVRVMPA